LPSAEEQLDKRLAEQKEAEANGQGFITTPLLEYLKQKRAQKLKRVDNKSRKRAKEKKDIVAIAVNPNKKIVVEDKKLQRKEKGSSKRNRDEKRKKREKGDEVDHLQNSSIDIKSKQDLSLKVEDGDLVTNSNSKLLFFRVQAS